MIPKYAFNRHEFAGALGDLGTILPLALGMILVNGLDPAGVFLSLGGFYILSGIYFGITVPVEPMKVIGAYAIGAAMTVHQIQASSLLMALCLLVIGITGGIDFLGRYIPKSVIRGVQMSTGILLMVKGVKMMAGVSAIQALHNLAEPYLRIQAAGPVPMGLIIGIAGTIATLAFLNNKKLPAGLIVVALGIGTGLVLGTWEGLDRLSPGFYLPPIFPYGFPSGPDFTFAVFAVVLPQIPMTLGNAVIAQADLSQEYFGRASGKMTYASLCVSMAVGNALSFLVGGIPVCHGAGGLAAHYRFGARTAGSNLIIGSLMAGLVLVFGGGFLFLLYLIPMAVLGVLLIFAGSQLALTVMDMTARNEMFVVTAILAVTLASNLAVAFVVGVILAYATRKVGV